MYQEFYGLKNDPFRLSPDAKQCFQHSTYKKAKSYMRYALHRGEGIVLVTGKPGTGKTSLVNELATELAGSKIELTTLVCNKLGAEDLVRLYATRLGIEPQDETKSSLLNQLESYLIGAAGREKRPVLVLDEAQTLSAGALEQVRMLTNFQSSERPLLQVFLVGQQQLRAMVLSPQLEQLHQRVVASCHIEPLTANETKDYMLHRLHLAAWQADPQIKEDVFSLIYKSSLGIPRWINLIGSRLLLHGMVEEKRELEMADIRTVLKDLFTEDLLPAQARAESHHLLDLNSSTGS